jgi:hypothetical protein
MSFQAVIARWEAESPPNVQNRNDHAVVVDYAERDWRGFGQRRHLDHREDPLDRGKVERISLTFETEDYQ